MTERIHALMVFFLLGLGLLGLRAWQLQVLSYEQYALRSRGNYLKTQEIPAPRGRILDRKGRVIAEDRLAFDLVYYGGKIPFAERILPLLGLESLPEVGKEPAVLKAGLPQDLIPTLAELTAGQENLKLVERIERAYPNPISGPVLGYVLLANPEQVQRGYRPYEQVGQSGLEAALEPYLRGQAGVKVVEVNVRGEPIRETILREPTPGRDVVLTLDLELQRAAERALEEALSDINRGRRLHRLPEERTVKGAILALDPRTGEVLAMASSPGFDPRLFARRPVPKEVRTLLQDPSLPLLNRAVQAYTPGSTFKLATSYALLEEGYVSPKTPFRCSPHIVYGGQIRRNWAGWDMGPMTVREAIAQSCNTWYYQAVAQDPLGLVDRIARRAKLLGLGRPTGLEIGESRGLLPTRAWKEALYEEPWYPGETLSVSIGQGPVLATPAQIGRMLATIAMNGQQPTLHLVKAIGGMTLSYPKEQIPGRFFGVLQAGLRATVTEGTARHLLGDFPVPTGGKTGTAEVPGKRIGLEHAWYMGYGPTDPESPYPPLVVVAFFENGGEGSRVALPAAKKVMAAYWKVE